jgi:hypothetical protein
LPQPSLLLSPTDGRLSADQAIDLIWKGDYDRAERALQVLAHDAKATPERAELLVYLAFLASIRHEEETARTLLRQALAESPGLALSPVEFPKTLRDLLVQVRADLVQSKPRPARGSLGNPQSVLARAATPPGFSGRKPWYRRWYVWAGVGAAAAVAVVALGSGDGDGGPTATPTRTMTPMPTPTLFYYPGPGPDNVAFSEAEPPCNGGETLHQFDFPPPPTPSFTGTAVVRSAVVTLQVQGDYDGDEKGEFVRLAVEENRGLFAHSAELQPYCTSSFEQAHSTALLAQQIQAALRNDGRIGIRVLDDRNGLNLGHLNHCEGTCTPFHQVTLRFTYSIVAP